MITSMFKDLKPDGNQWPFTHKMYCSPLRGAALATTLCFLGGCAQTQEIYSVDSHGVGLSDSQLMSRNVDPMQKHTAEERHADLTASLATDFDNPVKLLHGGFPSYPVDLRRAGVEGVVTVRFTVNENGLVEDANILSSPDERLSDLSLESIRSWRFAPLVRKGSPSKGYFVQKFPFRLVP